MFKEKLVQACPLNISNKIGTKFEMTKKRKIEVETSNTVKKMNFSKNDWKWGLSWESLLIVPIG